jgi:hypothetical protein
LSQVPSASLAAVLFLTVLVALYPEQKISAGEKIFKINDMITTISNAFQHVQNNSRPLTKNVSSPFVFEDLVLQYKTNFKQ